MKITNFVLLFSVFVVRVNAQDIFNACSGSDVVQTHFTEYWFFKYYTVYVKTHLKAGSNVTMQFHAPNVWVSVDNKRQRLTSRTIYVENDSSELETTVSLSSSYKSSDIYVTSVLINGKEYCTNSALNSPPKLSCGQRKVKHNQLITHGLEARAGDWPWHVAISSIHNSTFRYICGGSLISDTFVLTAAHCVTKDGIPVLPEYLGISLGKTNLIGANENPQEREVFKIIVHENFYHKKLDNDIALLKLITPVLFNDYVQPVCMWSDRVDKTVPIGGITGSVVGWGFDQADLLSPTLRTAHIPLVSDEICIKRNPTFYGSFLNGYRFCAGLINGTSPCNGDSGGGFVVFIPNEDSGITSSPDGVWFIRGIISLALSKENYRVSVCDPNEYVIFTDVDKYDDWIKEHMK